MPEAPVLAEVQKEDTAQEIGTVVPAPSKVAFYNPEYFLDEATTSFELAPAIPFDPLMPDTPVTAAVVIHGATKSSARWNKARSKYPFNEELKVTKDGDFFYDANYSLNNKKALAMLITKIEGYGSEDGLTDPKEITALFTNPRAKAVVGKWDLHLNTLGNDEKK